MKVIEFITALFLLVVLSTLTAIMGFSQAKPIQHIFFFRNAIFKVFAFSLLVNILYSVSANDGSWSYISQRVTLYLYVLSIMAAVMPLTKKQLLKCSRYMEIKGLDTSKETKKVPFISTFQVIFTFKAKEKKET